MIGLIQNTFKSKYLAILFIICLSQTSALSQIDTTEKARQDIYALNSTDELKEVSLQYALNNQPELAMISLKRYFSLTGDLSLLNEHIYSNIKDSKEFKALKDKYTPKLTSFSIIYLYAGLLGFYIFVMLNVRKKVNRTPTILISLFVLFHSVFILHLSLYIINYQYYLPHTLFISTTFSFLYGPLLYFYFKSVMHEYTFKWKDALHLVPSLILLVYISPYYTMTSLEKFNVLLEQDSLLLPGASAIITGKIVSLVVYAALILKMYMANASNNKKGESTFVWQRNIISIFIIYTLAYIVYAGILTKIINYPKLMNLQILVMVALVFYVAYVSYVQPEVFKGERKLVDPINMFKYKNSGLTSAYSNELKKSLLRLLEEEKVYKQNNISMAMLSERLGTSRHNTSQIINEHFDMNFFELINTYRIAEAREILKEDSNNNLNMIDVAYEVGFNNKVTFNKSFKKHTFSTPTQFLKSLQT